MITITYFEVFVVAVVVFPQNQPVFRHVAVMLWLVVETWRQLIGFFGQNMNYDVLIG